MNKDNNKNSTLKNRSQNTNFLNERLNINEKRGLYDLNDFIFSNIQSDKFSSVLDLGCGRGKQILRFVEENDRLKITGVDISKESIDFIKSKIKNNLKVDLHVSPMGEFLSTNKKKFDLVISTYALYYITDIKSKLNYIKNAINESGEFCVIGPYGRNNYELFNLIGYTNIDDYIKYTSSTFMVEMINFISKEFSLWSVATMINPINYASVDEVMDYWKSSTFYKEELHDEVLNKLNNHFKNNDLFTVNKYVMFCSGKNPL